MVRLSFASARRAPRRSPPFFRTKKLAIVGNTASKHHTPWFDPSWTIAVHPCTKKDCLREPDWWFDLHGPQNFRVGRDWCVDYPQWLKTLRTPIFMQQDWPDIPMAVAYPLPRILAEYRAYFTNHVAFMIALAMTEGVTHIGVFGCEYAHRHERGTQRGSLEFWLGMFEGHGGHVILPPGSTVLNEPAQLYGYESHDKHGKLIAAYRPQPKPAAPLTATSGARPLTVVDEQTAVGRIPLMKLPDNEPPAWTRSGHLIQA